MASDQSELLELRSDLIKALTRLETLLIENGHEITRSCMTRKQKRQMINDAFSRGVMQGRTSPIELFD